MSLNRVEDRRLRFAQDHFAKVLEPIMLCLLKIRTLQTADDDLPFRLRVTAKHAVGGAGGLLMDELGHATADQLAVTLHALGVAKAIASNAIATMHDSVRDRWISVGLQIQIPFDILLAAGLYLEDRD